tara:strand:- start:102 stop:290 length:189 start_codon:yes stop_codon:yes gene_type:complete
MDKLKIQSEVEEYIKCTRPEAPRMRHRKSFSKNETKNDIEKLLVSPLITHKEHSEIVTDLSL